MLRVLYSIWGIMQTHCVERTSIELGPGMTPIRKGTYAVA